MSAVLDVTADQPPSTGQLAVQELTPEEVASLAEELVAYHQHFAPLFYRREQKEWAQVYLRGLLTVDSRRVWPSARGNWAWTTMSCASGTAGTIT